MFDQSRHAVTSHSLHLFFKQLKDYNLNITEKCTTEIFDMSCNKGCFKGLNFCTAGQSENLFWAHGIVFAALS